MNAANEGSTEDKYEVRELAEGELALWFEEERHIRRSAQELADLITRKARELTNDRELQVEIGNTLGVWADDQKTIAQALFKPVEEPEEMEAEVP